MQPLSQKVAWNKNGSSEVTRAEKGHFETWECFHWSISKIPIGTQVLSPLGEINYFWNSITDLHQFFSSSLNCSFSTLCFLTVSWPDAIPLYTVHNTSWLWHCRPRHPISWWQQPNFISIWNSVQTLLPDIWGTISWGNVRYFSNVQMGSEVSKDSPMYCRKLKDIKYWSFRKEKRNHVQTLHLTPRF